MKPTGTFVAEDVFCLTQLGWVLAGTCAGTISSGQRLVFADGRVLRIRAVHWPRPRPTAQHAGLLLEAAFESRQQVLDLGILGATAAVYD